jgi:ABC-type glycerol-3-phosphate transport system permease component
LCIFHDKRSARGEQAQEAARHYGKGGEVTWRQEKQKKKRSISAPSAGSVPHLLLHRSGAPYGAVPVFLLHADHQRHASARGDHVRLFLVAGQIVFVQRKQPVSGYKYSTLRALGNSLIVAGSCAALTTYFSAMTAFGLHAYQFRFKQAAFSLFCWS